MKTESRYAENPPMQDGTDSDMFSMIIGALVIVIMGAAVVLYAHDSNAANSVTSTSQSEAPLPR